MKSWSYKDNQFKNACRRNYYRWKRYNVLRGVKMERKKLAILMALAVVLPVLTGCIEKVKEVSGFDMETIDSIKSE
ncbi:MAG TPA: hypothetical protein ENG71_04515, partial [Thermoplasmatales archaeon]|nr:hypothetical protein [Thermoplasmatales archaeon]